MKILNKVNWGESLLWVGFAVSLAYVPEEGLDAITTMGVFAIAAIGVRATRPAVNERGDENA